MNRLSLLVTLVLANFACMFAFGTPLMHSHNDYAQQKPLFGALAARADSIEADIFLVDGQLFVAHNRKDIMPENTLEDLYLKPLEKIIKSREDNGPNKGVPLTLLIDIKTEALPTYQALHLVLKNYSAILTSTSEGTTKPGPLTVIISGNRPIEYMRTQQERYSKLDGTLEDLDAKLSCELMPLVSINWRKLFRWGGNGAFPKEENEKLQTLVKRVHADGRQLRFWGSFDRKEVWRVLIDAKVDYIGTDKPKALREYLDNNLNN